jgi:hypothetical protein
VLGTFVGNQSYFNDAVAATKQTVKAGLAKLYGFHLTNTTGLAAYLQIFDALAANVTVGVTAAKWTLRLAANESLSVPFSMPLDFANGIVIAGTTTPTGSVGAAISVSAVYQ